MYAVYDMCVAFFGECVDGLCGMLGHVGRRVVCNAYAVVVFLSALWLATGSGVVFCRTFKYSAGISFRLIPTCLWVSCANKFASREQAYSGKAF